MSNTNTGGPAFPLHNHGTQSLGLHFTGMTMRDYFAAKAMQACIASGRFHGYSACASDSYQMADAMLKAREA